MSYLNALSKLQCVRIALLLLLLDLYAVAYDQWWHNVFGRPTFFIPPHLFVYGLSGLLVLFSWYAWRRFKGTLWKRLGILMTIMPISAPFDNFWHAMFGVENAASVWVSWSPPHLVLAVMFMFADYLVLALVRAYETDLEAKKWFTLLLFASLASSIDFILQPVAPFFRFHLLGMLGYLLTMPIFVSLLLLSRRHTGFAGATILTVFYLTGTFIATRSQVMPYAPFSAQWLDSAPLILAALVVDILPPKTAIFLQAWYYAFTLMLARVLAYLMFSYGAAASLGLDVAFPYGPMAAATLIGGMLGGALLYWCEPAFVHALLSSQDKGADPQEGAAILSA